MCCHLIHRLQDRTKVTAHIIFGVLSPSPKGTVPGFVLALPPSYTRRLPLHGHPSTAVATPTSRWKHWHFRHLIKWAWDPLVLANNDPESPTRTNKTTVGGGGLEWAAWFELKDAEERITTPSLAVLADIFINSPLLLPKRERGGLDARQVTPSSPQTLCIDSSILLD
jgi:hypothetical protein